MISFVDLDAGSFLERFRQNIGGRVLDAAMTGDGAHALVVVDREPGAVIVDVRNRTVKANAPLDTPGGVGAGDGGIVYVTSQTESAVSAFELKSERSSPYSGTNGTAEAAAWAESLQAMFALRTNEAGIADILSMALVRATGGFALASESIGKTLVNPVGIVLDGPGRRALIAAQGFDANDAGITMVAARPGGIPVSSSVLYPVDPDVGRRYRPRSAAIVYGR